MMKVKDLKITTNKVEINVNKEPFIESLQIKKDDAIKTYGDYKVIQNIVHRNSTFILIQED